MDNYIVNHFIIGLLFIQLVCIVICSIRRQHIWWIASLIGWLVLVMIPLDMMLRGSLWPLGTAAVQVLCLVTISIANKKYDQLAMQKLNESLQAISDEGDIPQAHIKRMEEK